MSSSCHFPKPLSSNAIRAVNIFLSKSETARNTRTADIFWLSTIFHFFCHLLKRCRAIIKLCQADFLSNRNSSSSPCPKLISDCKETEKYYLSIIVYWKLVVPLLKEFRLFLYWPNERRTIMQKQKHNNLSNQLQ